MNRLDRMRRAHDTWRGNVAGCLLLIAVSFWAVSIVAAPMVIARDEPTTVVALLPYLIGRFICHQQPMRSFHIGGVQMPVCARCAGLYAGAAAGALIGMAWRSDAWRTARVRQLFLVSGIPTAASLLAEWTGVAAGGLWSRSIAALPLGAAVAWVLTVAVRGQLQSTFTQHSGPDRLP